MGQEGEPVIRIGELLVRSGVITATDLSEAEKLSSHMKVQFGRLLIMAGCLTEEALECALEAQGLCRQGLMTSDIAIEALAFAVSENISLQEALEVLDILPQFGTSTLKLAELIHDANIIDEEKLQDAFDTSMETNQALAEVLVEMQCITPTLLPILQRMQDQIRTETLDRDDAINELRGTFKIWKKADKALSDDPMSASAIIGSKTPGAPQEKPSRFTSSFDTFTKIPAVTPDTAASIIERSQSAGNAIPPATASSANAQPVPASPPISPAPNLGYVHPGEKSQPQHKSASASGEVDWVLHHYGAGGIGHPASHPARIQQPDAFSYADDDEQRISDLLDIFASEVSSTSPQSGSQTGKSSSPGVSAVHSNRGSIELPSASYDSPAVNAPRPVGELFSSGGLTSDASVTSDAIAPISPTPANWLPTAPKSPSSSHWSKTPSVTGTGELPTLPRGGFGRDTGNTWPTISPLEAERANQKVQEVQAKSSVPPPIQQPATQSTVEKLVEQAKSATEFRVPGQPKSPRKADQVQTYGKGLGHAERAVEEAKGPAKGLGHPDRAKEQSKGLAHPERESKGSGHPARAREEGSPSESSSYPDSFASDYAQRASENGESALAGSASGKLANPFTVARKLGAKKDPHSPIQAPGPEASSPLHGQFDDELARQLLGEPEISAPQPAPLSDSEVEEHEGVLESETLEIEYEAAGFEASEEFVSTAVEFLPEPDSELTDAVLETETAMAADVDSFAQPSPASSYSGGGAGGTRGSLSISGSHETQLGSISGERESLFSPLFREPIPDEEPAAGLPFDVLPSVVRPLESLELQSDEAQSDPNFSHAETQEDELTRTRNRLAETRARRAASMQTAELADEDAEPGFSIDFSTESERAEIEALERERNEYEALRADEQRESAEAELPVSPEYREGEEVEAPAATDKERPESQLLESQLLESKPEREEKEAEAAAKEREETEAREAAEKEREEKEAEAAAKEREETEAREAAEKEREEPEAREAAEKDREEKEAEAAAKEREETEAREAAEKEREETEAREAAEKEREETEAREAAEKERQEAEAREAAEKERQEAEAREAAEKERQEAEAREAAEKERQETEAREAAEKEREETEAREAAEKEREETEARESAQDELQIVAESERASIEKAALGEDQLDTSKVDAVTVADQLSPLVRQGTKAHHGKKHRDDKHKVGTDAEGADFVHMLEAAHFFSEAELHDAIIDALSDPHKAVEILSAVGVIDRSFLDAAARLYKLTKTHAVEYDKAIESLEAMRDGKLKPADLTNQLGMKKPKRRK